MGESRSVLLALEQIHAPQQRSNRTGGSGQCLVKALSTISDQVVRLTSPFDSSDRFQCPRAILLRWGYQNLQGQQVLEVLSTERNQPRVPSVNQERAY